jgi:PIN domain nuclease of toxin-antitoxin system
VASVVLDASALLAVLQNEPGAETVRDRCSGGAVISAANWGEALSKLVDDGEDIAELSGVLASAGVLGEGLEIAPLDAEDARRLAELRPLTRHLGLSLGDRACLALATRLGLPALTTDRTWAELDLPVEVTVLR